MFGSDYAKFIGFVKLGEFLFIRASVVLRYNSDDQFEPKILQIQLLSEIRDKMIKNIQLVVDMDMLTERLIMDIEVLLQNNKGKANLKMQLWDKTENVFINTFSKKYSVALDNGLLEAFDKMDGVKYRIT